MLELLGGVLSAASGGGLLGIVGGLFRHGLEWLQKKDQLRQDLELLKERNRHESDMREKDRAILQLEVDGKLRVAKTEGDALVEKSRYETMSASFSSDKATFATGEKSRDSKWFVMVDVMRGGIRPTLTVFLDVTVVVIWGVLVWMLWGELAKLFALRDPMVIKPMMDLLVEIVKAIVFLATTATGYWFVAKTQDTR